VVTDTLVLLPTIASRVESWFTALNAVVEQCQCEVHCSMDGFAGDIPSDPRVTFDASPERRGLVAAYRAGFAHFASGTWSHLILLEDGITVTPGWDTLMRRTLDAHPEFGWVACGQIENLRAPFTSLCSMMTREAALATNGGQDLLFAPCQFDDGDMFMRLMKAGFRPHAVLHLVHHPISRTSRQGTLQDDLALMEAHRLLFQERWGMADFTWDKVPVHRGCGQCQ